MYAKRGLFILVIMLAGVLADSDAPDNYQYQLRYDKGTIFRDWVTACDTNPSDDSDDWSGGFQCSVNVGTDSNPVDCSEEGDINITWRFYHEPDGGLPYQYVYTNSRYLYTIHYDNDEDDCDCFMGTQHFNIGGETAIGECCGDDANEFRTTRTCASSCLSNGNDDGCCDAADNCVYTSQCYDDTSCRSASLYCDNGIWHDADDSEPYCIACQGNGLWGMPFEAGNPSCCGDDANEFNVSTHASHGCCDDPTDFVHSGGTCENIGNARQVYGFIFGQLPDRSYAPLKNARGVVSQSDWSDVNVDYTDAAGYYNVTVPPGTYHISAQKPGYETETIMDVNVNGPIRQDFWLDLTNECREDCSRYVEGEFRCDKACDGINTCWYDPLVTSDYFSGLTMKELCHNNLQSWQVKHSATHQIECCSGGYIPKPDPILAWVEISEKVKNAQTFFAGVVNYEPTGELYSVYIVVYSNE